MIGETHDITITLERITINSAQSTIRIIFGLMIIPIISIFQTITTTYISRIMFTTYISRITHIPSQSGIIPIL